MLLGFFYSTMLFYSFDVFFSTWVGKNFLYWYGWQPDLVVTEPEIVKEILCDKEGYPKVELHNYTRKLIGDGVTSSNGEKWAKMRKLANIFHGENLKVSLI